MLFTQARDPRRQLYDGFPPDSLGVERATGIPARSIAALAPMLDSLAGAGWPVYTLRDYASNDVAQADSLTRGASFMRGVRRAPPRALIVRDAHPILDSLRARKSPAEQAMLRRAIDITVAAQREAMRTIRPGMYEYEIEALFTAAFRRTGGDGPAFVSIIGSGPNSTQYHYNANDRRMQAGDVVVMDVGAGYGGYAADVTRTVPVSGRFSAEQRAIYGIVREAQLAAERVVRARRVVRGLAGRGAGGGRTGRRPAGPDRGRGCHLRPALGRPVRRRSRSPAPRPSSTWPTAWATASGSRCTTSRIPGSAPGTFAAGDVFTIEPGVYVSRKLLEILPDTPKNRAMIAKVRDAVARYDNIGMRIEDDYLVTPSGVEWLSRAPREIAEVEAAMAGR